MGAVQPEQVKRDAEQAIARGDLEKARDMLKFAVQRSWYDQDLYEMYGRALLHTGDLVQAGKWLFLSGRRAVAYNQAIDQYLARYAKAGGLKLYRSFPSAARLGKPDNYPPPLNEELRTLGVPDDAPPAYGTPADRSRFATSLAGIGCVTGFFFMLASLIVGAVTIVQWIKNQVAAMLR